MKFTFGWLKEYLDTSASLQEICDKLTSLGLIVDKVENRSEELEAFKICEIVDIEQHPNADRLKVCKVNTGHEMLQIVCGGANARQGLKTVLASVGSTIPSSKTAIKLGKVRDVESHGMLCSGEELLLEHQSDGIIEVDPGAPVGAVYAQWLGLDDPFIEIEITPNRGDCLGVYGVARDLSASGIGKLKPLKAIEIKGQYPCPISLTVDTKASPYFTGRLIRGVKNGPSPLWLQRRLESIGLRPISALVDITNFITYDRGRPLHVFDADKIKGNLNVRFSTADESFTALDGNVYTLSDDMTVIADQSGVISLAGIMGGESTGCDVETQNVFLESAYFEPIQITFAGQNLGIISDARYRFERGVDPETTLPGLEAATQMILDICGGEASEMVVSGKIPDVRNEIKFDPSRTYSLGGLEISQDRQKQVLSALGFSCKDDGKFIQVKTPSWRPDVEHSSDLVEEILRVEGYDKIPAVPYPGRPTGKPLSSLQERRFVVREVLANQGLLEVVTYSFISLKDGQHFGGIPEELILLNPISQELAGMRPSLLPSLLKAVHDNQARGQNVTAFFEVGPQYSSSDPKGQSMMLAGLRAGKNAQGSWNTKERPINIYDVKADVAQLFNILGLTYQWDRTAPEWYHPGRSAALKLGKNILGYFGEIHPRVLKAFDIKGTVVAFELFLDDLPLSRRKSTQKPIGQFSLYQAVERDFSFVVDKEIPADSLIMAALKDNKEFGSHVTIFDVFEMEGNKKAIGLRFKLQAADHTLTDQEIQSFSDKVVSQVQIATGGVLRQ